MGIFRTVRVIYPTISKIEDIVNNLNVDNGFQLIL